MAKSAPKGDSFGDRMKGYENVYRFKFMRRTPVIIRLDGKAFHTWTRGLDRPHDDTFISIMAHTTKFVVDNIQGASFAYTQSDEISILLRDYDTLTTDAWFDNNLQKMVSVAASLATAKFNQLAAEAFEGQPLAMFDARAFTLPKEEVVNYFIWRQNDAVRNSIRSVATHYLGHAKCHGLNNAEVQDLLMQMDIPVNWNDLAIHYKRGLAYNSISKEIDVLIPVFSQSRDYVSLHIEKLEEPEVEYET
ncbi:tRNAHis-5'-guanylyltransferase [Xanthomonas phage Xoo-sp13]|nr:tRNAHis-5'-guanylyltransferase [Xanthomonas phage Xoo-sp13]